MTDIRRFQKILIANRGEIALRIQRAIRELNMQSVAIFAPSDRLAPFVLHADEAYLLEGTTPAETYLDFRKIIDIALKSGVDAIHPGYGFLSENAEFAEAVIAVGIAFIGPSPDVLRKLGSKTSARELAQAANLPIVPGTIEPVSDPAIAATTGKEIGFPLLIKAAGGGGGKGMRIVSTPEELQNSLERASSEALKAFADSRVYLERYLVDPRHIEIQILADNYGTVLHFGERECSIQRRHQKVIEECPSNVLTSELRQAMGDAAVRIASLCSYTGAGTVEFLLDASGNFYFLEVNTRIQVEHPVTEMVYGIDLVRAQIRIAEGERLSLTQKDIHPVGHAIECRICAEDPDNGFLPSIGHISAYQPAEGPGIRNDSGLSTEMDVTPLYDPLLAKLIAWDKDRDACIAKMMRALEDYHIAGVKTTIPFCLWALQQPQFVSGTYDINFITKFFKGSIVEPSADELSAAGIAADVSELEPPTAGMTGKVSAGMSAARWKQRSGGWKNR
jgi:propionyl-CoA carboxylase alpha chain